MGLAYYLAYLKFANRKKVPCIIIPNFYVWNLIFTFKPIYTTRNYVFVF